jgi:hypothetical protein
MRIRREQTWAGGILAGLGVLTLAAGIALAEETKTDGAATQAPAGQTTPSATPATPADQSTAPATTPNATPATPDAKSTPVPIPSGDPAAVQAAAAAADPLTQIRDQGKKLDASADKKASAAIETAVNDVEKNVATDGDKKIAERLAGEFGVSVEMLTAEKDALKVNWGQLMLARTLLANSATELSTRQLFDLRNEGMSWAQIASGMGLKLGEVLNAAKAEAKVAKGLAKADGKVAVVHGSGSKAGISGSTKTASTKEAAATPASAKDASPKAEAQSATPSGAPETAPGK